MNRQASERNRREREWDALMRASVDGDTEAYRRLLSSLAEALRAQARRGFARVGLGGEEVEDVVQETLLAVHLKRHTWLRTEPVAPWVTAIARHKLLDALRRRGRRAEVPLDSLSGDVDAAAIATPPAFDAVAHDVERLMAQLNARQRDIVRSISMAGYTVRETAERLNMSEVAVRVTLHRSLKLLAARYRSVPE